MLTITHMQRIAEIEHSNLKHFQWVSHLYASVGVYLWSSFDKLEDLRVVLNRGTSQKRS